MNCSLVDNDVFDGVSTNGDRSHKRNLIVLLTDGGSNDMAATLKAASATRVGGATIVTVSIGNWVNWMEINELTSDPDDKNVFRAGKFTDLANLVGDMKNILCNGKIKMTFSLFGDFCIKDDSETIHKPKYMVTWNIRR